MAKVHIDNRTPKPVTFHSNDIKHGYPNAAYPPKIEKGQGASFSNNTDTFGSVAAVVYRGKIGTEDCDHLIAWSNPLLPSSPNSPGHGNSVWAETREAGTYTDIILKNIYDDMLAKPRSNHHDEWNGCVSNITITNETHAKVEVTFTFKRNDA